MNGGRRRELYYFRDEQGLEVDFLVPGRSGAVTLVECKATGTVNPAMAGPMRRLAEAMKSFRAVIADAVNTLYIYKMSGRLVNVRLDGQRLRMARKLRVAGITLSDLVREAIDRRYEQVVALSEPRDVTAIMKRIYEQCPDPSDLPPRRYNVHSRTEARGAILGKLRKSQKTRR